MTNRAILIGLPLLALVAAFWLLVLSPKREEASRLESEAIDLRSQVDAQEQAAALAEEARRDFPRAYQRLVVLGKATPSDDDTASMMFQLDRIAADSSIDFLSVESKEGASQTAPPPSVEAPQTPAQAAESSEQQVANAEAGSAPPPVAPPTEAGAANLPIGATIGDAALPVMKHQLTVEGSFEGLSRFLAGVDGMVRSRNGGVGVRGRLITVDGFELEPVGDPSADPIVSATFEITTYLTPPEEGATAGADPAGPAPATDAQAVSDPTVPVPSNATASTLAP